MMQDYRDWLGADSYEAVGSIGGSFVSDNIEDYYVNPFELGYGFYIGWKKNFIGKDALTKLKDSKKNRKKVTHRVEPRRPAQGRRVLVRGRHAVQVDRLPAAELRVDERGHADERRARWSACRCSTATRSTSAACCRSRSSNDDVQIGDQLTLIWGEPQTTGKTSTEPHKQAEIRVLVAPTPYAREARETLRGELAHQVVDLIHRRESPPVAVCDFG